jgi:hypothetical protein
MMLLFPLCVFEQHNDLAESAMSVGAGNGSPTPQLRQVWTKAQDIRQWLTLGTANFEDVDAATADEVCVLSVFTSQSWTQQYQGSRHVHM